MLHKLTKLVAHRRSSAVRYVTSTGSMAIGLIAQTGGIATVFGPPLAGHVIGGQGWDGFGWFLAGAGVVGALCLLPLLIRRSERGLAV